MTPTEKTLPYKSKEHRIEEKAGAFRSKELLVFMTGAVYDEIHKHAEEEGKYEVGGALIGDYHIDSEDSENKVRFVDIYHIIKLDRHNHSAVDITFPTEFWMKKVEPEVEAMTQKDEERRHLRIGTYHTHPGHTVFLSPTDMKFVRNIFNQPWNVTMVVDPINDEEGVFFWINGKLTDRSGFFIYRQVPTDSSETILPGEDKDQEDSDEVDL